MVNLGDQIAKYSGNSDVAVKEMNAVSHSNLQPMVLVEDQQTTTDARNPTGILIKLADGFQEKVDDGFGIRHTKLALSCEEMVNSNGPNLFMINANKQ